jgi:hypothetical protein
MVDCSKVGVSVACGSAVVWYVLTLSPVCASLYFRSYFRQGSPPVELCTYVGSRRYKAQNYQDMMAICIMAAPDLIVTSTSNFVKTHFVFHVVFPIDICTLGLRWRRPCRRWCYGRPHC